MRNLILFAILMMAVPVAHADSVPGGQCHVAISDAAKAFAPSLSGGRCTGFIEEEGSLKPYKAPGVFVIRVHTLNGSCSHNIWVKVDRSCHPKSVGEAK